MSVKKSREFRFTWQDKDGALRVVHVHAQHMREGKGDDEVRLHITHDGAPVSVETFVQDIKPVKTHTRM